MAAPGAEHDYFADLIERQDGSQGATAGEPDLMFSAEPPVLPMQSTSEPTMPSPGLPALDIEEAKSATPNGPSLKPMGEGLGKRQARETQEIVESVMGRFASGLQSVLEHTNRRLEALEERTDNLNQLVVDLGKSIEANTRAAQEQNASIERSFRELARGIQLIRDKQELAETHAELAKFRPELRHGSIGAASELAPSPAASIPPAPAPASAPAAAPAQPTAVEQAATLPAPPPPVNTAPSAPSAPPASAPPAPQPAPVPQPAAPQASAPMQPLYAAPQQQLQAQQQAPQPAAELQPQYSAPVPPQAPSPVQQQLPPQPQAPAPPQLQQPQQQQQAPQYQPAAPQLPVQSMPPPQQYASSPHAGGQYPGAPPQPQQQYSAPPLPPASAGYTRPQEPPAGAPYQGPPPAQQQPHQAMYLPPPRPLAPTPPPQHSYEQVAPPPQQAQYAPQPPVPPRAPGPPQGLWRGPQPDPYSRPPPASTAGGGRPQAQAPQARDVPLERVIDEVASMGFSRHEVRETVVQLMNSGKTVDLNVVLDRLMNRGR